MKPLMHRDRMEPYELRAIRHIDGVDHPESISVGPHGEAYTTGARGQVYRLHLAENTFEEFASTAPRQILGQAVDAKGNLYCADPANPGGRIVRIPPQGKQDTYSYGPAGGFLSANTPVFDKQGNLYVSDTGTWTEKIDGRICRIPPGGGEAIVWSREPVDTPNGIALDPDERFVYMVETWGNSIGRIPIQADGSAGDFERVLHMRDHVPDGIAFDELGRIWIACHRPDRIYVFDVKERRLELFADDPQGEALRGPCHVAFAGADREILLASSLDRATVHRFDHPGMRGLRMNCPVF